LSFNLTTTTNGVQSGKLPITMPRRVADSPSALCFRSEAGRVIYGEDVYVGYRWYDTLDIEPLFPFGHGLSYTNFTLSDVETPVIDGDKVTVRVGVRNCGSRDGTAVVQAYVAPPAATPVTATAASRVTRPTKELKGFAQVRLSAGAEGVAEIEMDVLRATSYWSEMKDCWRSETGTYRVLLGMSSRGDIVETSFTLERARTWRGLRE
jgi:beta-glucosidase